MIGCEKVRENSNAKTKLSTLHIPVSEENRRLMQDILKKSAEDQDAMSNRVAALLAGTSLTTTAGTSVRRRDDIEEVNLVAAYVAVPSPLVDKN